MPTGWVDYNTRTKEQLIGLIEMIQRDRYKLEERIRFLEQCLDNKEKVNKSMRKEIRNLKLTIEQMENTCKDYLNDRDTLREENRNLKERIKELGKDYDRLKVAFEDVVSWK